MQATIKSTRDAVACRDAAIADLRTQLTTACAEARDVRAAHVELRRRRDAEAQAAADKQAQLAAAQARLAQVAPIMRRLAARTGS